MLVGATISGPIGRVSMRLALDAGATGTIVDPSFLTRVGYNLSGLPRNLRANTVNGPVSVSAVQIVSLSSLGIMAANIRVVAHRLQRTGFDGVLGLDFLRGHVLTIDYVQGTIELV